MEGYKVGTITKLPEVKGITRVRKDKAGVIYEYCIDALGWVPKEKGIRLAKQGEVNAVVCTSRLGNFYLRSKPDGTINNNFEFLD